MRLINSNPDSLMTNPEREMGRTVINPEAVNSVMRNIKRLNVNSPGLSGFRNEL
jgi:hypothetical protein